MMPLMGFVGNFGYVAVLVLSKYLSGIRLIFFDISERRDLDTLIEKFDRFLQTIYSCYCDCPDSWCGQCGVFRYRPWKNIGNYGGNGGNRHKHIRSKHHNQCAEKQSHRGNQTAYTPVL